MGIIRNPALAEEGRRKIEWVSSYMPVLCRLEEELSPDKPFSGLKIAMAIHLEAKTARLALALRACGAEVAVAGCNPLSTQDDVASGLDSLGVDVFAEHGVSMEEYETLLIQALSFRPHLILDDGGDFTALLHDACREYAADLIGGSEETTTGIARLKARQSAGLLNFPMLAVNDADCKHLFDNRYGTGQSTWEALLHTTNVQVTGKTVVVAGYGWCGRGVAMRASGLGARVIVTEVDPVKAIEAAMDGFTVLPMAQAAPLGDFFVTVTGCKDVITAAHMQTMKDGAILSNAGHFDVEISVTDLQSLAVQVWPRRRNITGYRLADGRVLNLLAEGRLVNLASGDGHPAEIMDMSFSLQLLSLLYMARHGRELAPCVVDVPADIDHKVASLKLSSMGLGIDSLTVAQQAYLNTF